MARMFLIDGSNHAFRVHFALPPMHAADGFPTRALYGFTTLFAKILRVHRPDYCAVAFDVGESFRKELYPDYKGHRPEMPEDLRQQWPYFPELVEGFGFPALCVDGYEADDVICTLAKRFAGPDCTVHIVTGDKDFCQIVSPHVRILDLMKDEEFGPEGVEARWGVDAARVVDLLGLCGDKSDNIPGVPGIGPKKAAQYLARYGDLEGVLANARSIGGKTGERLVAHAEDARLSKRLATIFCEVPEALAMDLGELAPRGVRDEVLRPLFERWAFGRVAQKLLENGASTVDRSTYRTITTEPELRALVEALGKARRFAFDLECTDLDTLCADIVGMSFCWGARDAAYLPLRHVEGEQVDPDVAVAALRPLLEDPTVAKIGQNLKYDLQVARRAGLDLRGIAGDTMLLDYVLSAHERTHGLDEVAARILGHTMIRYEEVTQGETLRFDEVDLASATAYAAEDAHVAWLVHQRLAPKMSEGQRRVYETIELPLVPVLAEMETTGIRVDAERLRHVHADLLARCRDAETACHAIAGRVFNVNSRQELQVVLFEELGYAPTKKVSDGWSTAAGVLEKLVGLREPDLPARILEYRQLTKLVGTYLDKLPDYVKPDGRIHTSFKQAVAATGRLASADPNLQNIPVRSFEGQRIRECFVPDPGHVFLSADYSQVELRILAHFCEEPALVEAFRTGEDIHRRTASEVFGVFPDMVSPEQRNAAKAINFGLLYGMSAFRLAGDLAVPQKQAERYMQEYFARMPRVIDWIEQSKEMARRDGFVETLFGRRRILPAIHAQPYVERMAAEREAVNTRVQGTAADIVKLAMIRVHAALARELPQVRLLLQVHDELLLEVPRDQIDEARTLVVHEMQHAADLLVPLAVNTAVGDNWQQAHG